MKKIFERIQYLFILGILFLPFGFIQADGKQVIKLDNPLKDTNSIQELLDDLLRIAVAIGTPIVVLAVIYSGFLFIKAQGNSDKLKEAREVFVWVIVGAVILLGAQLLETVISETISDLGAGI